MEIVKRLSGDRTYQIICTHCGCRTMAFDKTWSRPRAEAEKSWNRRALPNLEDMKDQLIGVLKNLGYSGGTLKRKDTKGTVCS
jgi:hypothetical protein